MDILMRLFRSAVCWVCSLFNEGNAMNLNKQMAVVVVAAMCAGATASTRTAAFAIETPNMAFEIDGDASNARFVFPRNTATGKDFWRLILDDGARTEIPVFSHAQKGLNPHSEQFPALFRYTFPEVIVSNRGVRNAEGGFAKMLRNALVYGIRYDAELYVCRRTLDANPVRRTLHGARHVAASARRRPRRVPEQGRHEAPDRASQCERQARHGQGRLVPARKSFLQHNLFSPPCEHALILA